MNNCCIHDILNANWVAFRKSQEVKYWLRYALLSAPSADHLIKLGNSDESPIKYHTVYKTSLSQFQIVSKRVIGWQSKNTTRLSFKVLSGLCGSFLIRNRAVLLLKFECSFLKQFFIRARLFIWYYKNHARWFLCLLRNVFYQSFFQCIFWFKFPFFLFNILKFLLCHYFCSAFEL